MTKENKHGLNISIYCIRLYENLWNHKTTKCVLSHFKFQIFSREACPHPYLVHSQKFSKHSQNQLANTLLMYALSRLLQVCPINWAGLSSLCICTFSLGHTKVLGDLLLLTFHSSQWWVRGLNVIVRNVSSFSKLNHIQPSTYTAFNIYTAYPDYLYILNIEANHHHRNTG